MTDDTAIMLPATNIRQSFAKHVYERCKMEATPIMGERVLPSWHQFEVKIPTGMDFKDIDMAVQAVFQKLHWCKSSYKFNIWYNKDGESDRSVVTIARIW